MRGVATQDEQFLKYDAEQIARNSSTATLSQLLDSTTLVLDWFQPQGRQSLISRKDSNEIWDQLKCEKFVANFEHLIRCLQHEVIEALLQERQEALRLLEIQFWEQYLQQQREIEGWFAEWPNGQPPLNTTWPWNVKPSLVVLWGVCWMFYDNENSWPHRVEPRFAENLRTGPSQPPRVGNNNHIEQRQRTSPREGHILNRHQKYSSSDISTVAGAYFDPDLTNISLSDQPPSGDRVPASDSQRDARSQDLARAYNPHIPEPYQLIYPNSTLPSNHFPTQSTDNPSVCYFEQSWNPQYNTNHNWQPFNITTNSQTREPQGKAEQPYVHCLQPQETLVSEVAAYDRSGMLVMPPQNNVFQAQEPSPCLSRSTLSPSAPTYPASTSSIGSPNTNHMSKMETVRKEDGLLHCGHADCVNEPRAFSRMCEYT